MIDSKGTLQAYYLIKELFMNRITIAMLVMPAALFAAQMPKVEPKSVEAKMTVAPKQEVVEVSIAAPEKSKTEIADLLNTLLADEYVLYVKTQNYHWNIRNSMNFNDLHLFFGKQYEMLAGFVDEVAERVRALGGRAFGTLSEFMKNSQLKEQEALVPTDKEMINNLLEDHEAIIRSLRSVISKTAELQDAGTNNFLSGLIEKHEKMAWMLRSYLK